MDTTEDELYCGALVYLEKNTKFKGMTGIVTELSTTHANVNIDTFATPGTNPKVYEFLPQSKLKREFIQILQDEPTDVEMYDKNKRTTILLDELIRRGTRSFKPYHRILTLQPEIRNQRLTLWNTSKQSSSSTSNPKTHTQSQSRSRMKHWDGHIVSVMEDEHHEEQETQENELVAEDTRNENIWKATMRHWELSEESLRLGLMQCPIQPHSARMNTRKRKTPQQTSVPSDIEFAFGCDYGHYQPDF
jgi:hypothetical protein